MSIFFIESDTSLRGSSSVNPVLREFLILFKLLPLPSRNVNPRLGNNYEGITRIEQRGVYRAYYLPYLSTYRSETLLPYASLLPLTPCPADPPVAILGSWRTRSIPRARGPSLMKPFERQGIGVVRDRIKVRIVQERVR